jgi:transcriptional regulator with XRE-family HTH domain
MSDIATSHDIPEITLGWRLRIAMERAGIKAADMAAEFGVHGGTITRWTHDIGATPRPIYLRRWSELCQVPYEWLVGDLFEDPTDRSAGAGKRTDNRNAPGGKFRRLSDPVQVLAAA